MMAVILSNFFSPSKPKKSVLILGLLWIVIALLTLPAVVLFSSKEESIWITAAMFLLFFAIINAVIGVKSKVWIQFAKWSALVYMLLTLFLLGYAGILSDFKWDEIKTYKVVYLTIFLSYFLMLGLGGTIKSIATWFKIDQDY